MITQKDIAQKLGVSRQLVTLALRGYPQVSQESRDRIVAAAKALGYRPNPHALALKTGRTGVVALWIPDLISTHFLGLARVMNRLVKQNRQELLISEVGGFEAETVLEPFPVDAVFVVDSPGLARMHSNRVPVISLGVRCYEPGDHVRIDLLAGAMDAVEHLVACGFQRILHLTPERTDAPHASRRNGYSTVMRKAGLTPEFLYYDVTDQQRPAARRLIQEYIRTHGRPEAIFCHSDDIMIGVYRGLCDLGLRVPADVALVGCDGIQDVEYMDVPLTTITLPVEKMCITAWQFFEQRTARPNRKPQRAVLKPQLSVRASTAGFGKTELVRELK